MFSARDRSRRGSDRNVGRRHKAVSRRRRPDLERLEDYVLLATFTVTNTLDSGAGSFRKAWNNVIAASPTPGTIQFAIPTTDPGYNAATNTWTISFTQDPPSDPSGKLPTMNTQVTVDGWSQGSQIGQPNYQGRPLIVINGSQTPATNALDFGTATHGGAGGSIVQGLSIVNFSYDSTTNNGGNAIIVEPTSPGVTIRGNYLGILPDGVTKAPNGVSGVALAATGATIGGTISAYRNVISGNAVVGIAMATLPPVNFAPIFTFPGIVASDNVIEGNYIGTNAAGTAAIANGYGIALGGTQNTTISGNVISGNGTDGVFLTSSGSTFSTRFPTLTTFDGFTFTIPDEQATGNTFTGNNIGTTFNGSTALPNGSAGIELQGDSTQGVTTDTTTIGGTASGTRNVIAGNNGAGILLSGQGVTTTTILGNQIGMQDVPNHGAGVAITDGAHLNTVGGISTGDGNVIAFNSDAGVAVGISDSNASLTTGNTIEGNTITGNTGPGIALGGEGTTVNDSHGHSGPNNWQNKPILSNLTSSGGTPTVTVTFDEANEPSTNLRIEFYDAGSSPSAGPGKTFLFGQTISTDSSGHYDGTFPVSGLPAGDALTATVTNLTTGDTSEFSDNATAGVTYHLTLNSVPSTATTTDQITFSADVTISSGTVSGTVDFLNGSTPLNASPISLDSNGHAAFTTALAQGSYSIVARYNGDGNPPLQSPILTAPAVPLTVSPPQAAPTTVGTVTVSPTTATVGDNVTLSVDVTSTGGTPTGTVDFKSGTTTLNPSPVPLDGNGHASFSTDALAQGSYSIVAVYGGTSAFQPGTSATPASLTINAPQAAPTTVGNVAVSTPTATVGTSVTLSVDVTSSGGTPTGTVNFKSGTTTLNPSPVPLDGNGHASFSTSSLAQGSYSIVAVYGGTSAFQAGTSATGTSLTINAPQAAPTTVGNVAVSTPTATVGTSVTLFVAVTSSGGTPTGTVDFKSGATTLNPSPVPLDGSGHASFATSSLAQGSYSIVAVYGGTSAFQAGTSATATSLTINAAPPAGVNIDVSISNTAPKAGDTVTFLATLTSSGGIPTGDAEIIEDGSILKTITLDTQGMVSYTTPPLTVGTHQFSVKYLGNSSFKAITLGPNPLVVSPAPTPTPTPTTPTPTPTTPTPTPTTPTPTPTTPTPTPTPHIVGVSLQTSKSSKGSKKKASKVVVVTFDGALPASITQDPNALQFVSAGKDKKFGTADDKRVNLGTPVYDPVKHTLTITITPALAKQALQFSAPDLGSAKAIIKGGHIVPLSVLSTSNVSNGVSAKAIDHLLADRKHP
jgi:parallel beta-helix repeat protein